MWDGTLDGTPADGNTDGLLVGISDGRFLKRIDFTFRSPPKNSDRQPRHFLHLTQTSPTSLNPIEANPTN